MNYKYTERIMRILNSMCADLNDIHNNYDEDTITEDNFRHELERDIKEFNQNQDYWHAELRPTRNGYRISYS